MKRSIYVLLMISLITILLTGCAAPAAIATPVATEAPAMETPSAVQTTAPTIEPTKIVVTDALDRTVEFDQPPARIVIAGKAGFMLANASFLFTEAPSRIIGYVAGSQTPNDFISMIYPLANNMAKLEFDASVDEIASLNPDLVMMKSYLRDDIGNQIEQLGINVIYLNLETPEAINKDIRTLGGVFGNSERAEQIIGLYDQSEKKITDVTSTLTGDQKPSVLMLQYSDKGGEVAFKVPPVDWLQTSIVEMAGGNPVWKDTPTEGWTVVTFEQIATWNPDVILLVDYKGRALEIVGNLKLDDKWSLLDAVKNSKIYAFPLDFQSWDQPDTRWTLGMTWIATKLHPDLFANVKMYQEIQYFYSSFYNLSDSTINNTIMPLIKGDL